MTINLNEITEEDQISKVDLAREIERTRQLFHSCDDEIWTQIKMFPERIKNFTTFMNETEKKTFEAHKKEVEEIVSKAKKDLEKIQADSVAKIISELKIQTASLFKRVSDVDEVAKRVAMAEVSRYMGSISKTVNDMAKSLEDYKRENSSYNSDYQIQTHAKLSQMADEFKDLRGKFKEIAKLLS